MNVRMLMITCAIGVLCFGCSQKSQTETQTSASAEVQATASAGAAEMAQASPAVAGSLVSFTDISGYDGEQAIKDLGALGVLDSTTGTFRPNDPITRADFARWLVKAQNAIVESAYHFRLAQSGPATFVDVPTSNPDFPYIQGLANSGFVIGVDPTHFAPQSPLTREQMIYVKVQVDEKKEIKTTGDSLNDVKNRFTDAAKIGTKYLGAIDDDSYATTTGTFKRVYGITKIFGPQQHVTRGEAAIALSEMRGEWVRSAAGALGRTPPP